MRRGCAVVDTVPCAPQPSPPPLPHPVAWRVIVAVPTAVIAGVCGIWFGAVVEVGDDAHSPELVLGSAVAAHPRKPDTNLLGRPRQAAGWLHRIVCGTVLGASGGVCGQVVEAAGAGLRCREWLDQEPYVHPEICVRLLACANLSRTFTSFHVACLLAFLLSCLLDDCSGGGEGGYYRSEQGCCRSAYCVHECIVQVQGGVPWRPEDPRGGMALSRVYYVSPLAGGLFWRC